MATVYNSNQRKIFVLIIALLLIANFAMLFFILNKDKATAQKRPDRKEQIANFLKNDVGFSQQQLQQFDSLNDRHWRENGGLFDSARTQKNEQFRMLSAENFSDTAIAKVIEKSAVMQNAMEKQMFQYIKNIRQLCNEQQVKAFDSGYAKIFNRRGDKKKKN